MASLPVTSFRLLWDGLKRVARFVRGAFFYATCCALPRWLKRCFGRAECPICLETFYMADAPVRCSHAQCSKEHDAVLQQAFSLKDPPLLGHVIKTGPSRGAPPALGPSQGASHRLTLWPFLRFVFRQLFTSPHRFWRRYRYEPSMECDVCRHTANQRLCPGCHAPLPSDFAQHPLYRFLLIGKKSSGKSTWLKAMLHRLTSNGLGGYGLHVAPATPPSPWHPQIWRLSQEAPHRVTRFVLMQEIPASALLEASKLETYKPYIRRTRGVVYTLDPTHLCPPSSASSLPNIPSSNGSMQALEALILLVRVVRETPTRIPPDRFKPNGHKDEGIPFALMVSKLDQLDHLLPTNSPLRQDTQPDGAYNPDDSYQISREIKSLFGVWFGAGFLETVHHTFLGIRHRFFGVTMNNEGAWRVEEPFVWLYHQD